MTLANTDSSVTLTFRVREQVTPALSRMEAGLTRLGDASARTGKFMAQNAGSFATAGLALVSVASVAGRLARQFGILNEEQSKTLETSLLVASGVAGVAGAIGSVGQLFLQTGIGAAGFGAALATIAEFALPVTVAVGALAIAIAAVSKEFTQGAGASAEFVQNALHAIGVTRPHAEFLAGGIGERARGGFENIRAGNRGGAGQFVTGGGTGGLQRGLAQSQQRITNVTISTFAATESELRTAAKTLGRILQEESRIGGFQIN